MSKDKKPYLNPNQEGLIGYVVYLVLYGLFVSLVSVFQAPQKIVQKLKRKPKYEANNSGL